jgi:hypothetical protein
VWFFFTLSLSKWEVEYLAETTCGRCCETRLVPFLDLDAMNDLDKDERGILHALHESV